MAVGHFNRYLSKKKKEREQDPASALARNQISNLSNNQKQSVDQLTADLSRSGYGAGTIIQARRETSQDFQRNAKNIYAQADAQNQQRRDAINTDIDKVELQKEEQKIKDKAAKAEQKKAWWTAGGSLLGTAAGAIAGNPALGAQAGAALGSVAGEVTSGNYMDPQQLMAGLGDTVQAVSDGYSLKREKAFGQTFKDNFHRLDGMSPQELNRLKMIYSMGENDLLQEFFSSFDAPETMDF